MKNGMLYTYRCPNCQTLAITSLAPIAGQPERCKCRTWLRLLYTTPITDAEREMTRQGLVFNPYAAPAEPVLCVRCERPAGLMTSRTRPDGRVCRACYEAEEHPPLTQEQMAANVAARAAKRIRDRQWEDEQEALNQGVTLSSTTGE